MPWMLLRPLEDPVQVELRIAVLRKFGKQSRASIEWGISEVKLSEILCGHRDPPPHVLDRVGIIKYKGKYYRIVEERDEHQAVGKIA